MLRWFLDAGIGIARSAVLIALTCLLPALWVAHTLIVFHWEHNFWLDVWWILWWVWGTTVLLGRWLCQTIRRLVLRWIGTEIHPAYRSTVPLTQMSTGFWWNGFTYNRRKWRARYQRWTRARISDPGAWRDMIWLVVAPALVGFLAALPLGLLGFGVYELVIAPTPGLTVQGIISILAGVMSAPYAWRIVGPVAGWLLGPSVFTRLSARVEQLVVLRGDLTGAQAAELQRIERNLHDGAQARLVALGMSLAAAEHFVDADPQRAKTIMRDAREAASIALAELRDLVRGIVPPVLTERGLVDAVKSLALDAPLEVEVGADFVGRIELPIESALYFGTAELITNAAKHSRARLVKVSVGHANGRATIEVVDDGIGGADPASGSGLNGLRSRLAAFDGTLEIDSPAGGPTVARMVVPCVLS